MDIEEEINLLKKFNPGDEYTERIKSAIDHVLAEMKEDKKKIADLKEIDEANRKVIVEQCDYIQNKSIPKEKVKDIIEETKNRLKKHILINISKGEKLSFSIEGVIYLLDKLKEKILKEETK